MMSGAEQDMGANSPPALRMMFSFIYRFCVRSRQRGQAVAPLNRYLKTNHE